MVKILDLVPMMQSVSILEDNIDFSEKKHKKSKDFVKQGAKNILGISLVGVSSKLANEFDSDF